MKVGFIGLGKMGKNMVFRLLENGVEVVAWNRSLDPLTEVVSKGAEASASVEDLISKLPEPRIVWLMLPPDVVEEFVQKLSGLLSAGDILIDGGNSFYKDAVRRSEVLKAKDVHFVDAGVSGGPLGAREGACVMVGGAEEDFIKIEPLIEILAAPFAYAHLGVSGAGHFAKMVHNGIEYGMMESIAEGVVVLRESSFGFNLAQVLGLYNKGSVVESRLVGWAESALKKDPKLSGISPVIGHTGEGEWSVKTAKELGVDVPVIAKSFQVRVNSRNDNESSSAGFRNKVVSAMRGKFGGHKVEKT